MMNPAVEAYAEKMVRDEWMRKLREQDDRKCPECGHYGCTHSPTGCCVWIDPPLMPFKNPWTGEIEGTCVDSRLTSEELETYKCKCHNPDFCRSNEQIIFGHDLPEAQNEPLDKSRDD